MLKITKKALKKFLAEDRKETDQNTTMATSSKASAFAASTIVTFLPDASSDQWKTNPPKATKFASIDTPPGFPMPDVPRKTTRIFSNRYGIGKEADVEKCVQLIVSHKDWPQNLCDRKFLQELSRTWSDPNVINYAIEESRWWIEQWNNCCGIPVALCKAGMVVAEDGIDSTLRSDIMRDLETLHKEEKTTVACHPHYTEKIVHYVHPSMYAYEKGVTRVLANGDAQTTMSPPWNKFVGIDGVPNEDLPTVAPKEESRSHPVYRREIEIKPCNVLWLPSEFVVHRSTGDTPPTCCINSYINNLNPMKYRGLYDKIGQLFAQALPLMEKVLCEVNNSGSVRKTLPRFKANERPTSKARGYMDHETRSKYDKEWEEAMKKYNKKAKVPAFAPPRYTSKKTTVDLHNRPLQVIVKLISLRLEPKEDADFETMTSEERWEHWREGQTDFFEGGHWHVEGTSEEHIVASACCYLDRENVTEGGLSFRDGSVGSGGCEFGTIATPPGRILVWPNYFHHKQAGAYLTDGSKPGHRTLCCFHLVDPTLRVRSTSTVPPQQKSWVCDAVATTGFTPVIGDTGNRIFDFMVDDGSYIDREQALNRRKRLSEERSQAAGIIAGNYWIPCD